MTEAEQKQFTHNYSKVLVQAWTDKTFKKMLHDHPVATLRQSGIVVEPDAKVSIETGESGGGDLSQQIKAWDEGHSTHTYKLYIPDKPMLGQVAGGDTSYCCSCCPCCTCT